MSLASAIPKAAEMEVEACPAPISSYSLSERFKKPLRPLNFLIVLTLKRPVSSL